MATPGTFAALLHRLQNLHIASHAGAAIEETKDGILKRNKDQLLHGFNSNGERLRDYKFFWYAELKNQMNPLPGFGTPDLFLEGNFQNRMDVQIVGDEVRTFSNDEKSEDLKESYDEDIFGLSVENGNDYIKNDFYPELSERIESVIKLPIGQATFRKRLIASLRKKPT